MKSSGHSEQAVLGGNLYALQEALKAAKLPLEDFGLLLLIADMMDEIAGKKDRYMIVGATTNRSAFSINVKGPDTPDPVYGADLEELNRLCFALL